MTTPWPIPPHAILTAEPILVYHGEKRTPNYYTY
jgi:hypothetical protein